MFIREAVKSLGAVYKPFSHGAVREGSAVGCFIAGFLPRSFYTVMQYISPLMLFTDSCLWVPTCSKISFELIKLVNCHFCKMYTSGLL